MSYPENFSTAAYDAIYGRDRIEPRETNAVELAAMRDLRALLLCLPALALAAFGASASSDTSGTAGRRRAVDGALHLDYAFSNGSQGG